jgi:hypothetical protein
MPDPDVVQTQIKGIIKVADDHEKRIRFLERIINYGIGVAAVLKFVSDLVGPILTKH